MRKQNRPEDRAVKVLGIRMRSVEPGAAVRRETRRRPRTSFEKFCFAAVSFVHWSLASEWGRGPEGARDATLVAREIILKRDIHVTITNLRRGIICLAPAKAALGNNNAGACCCACTGL